MAGKFGPGGPRAIISAAKAHPCADCGVQYPPYVMQLDHRGDKLFTVSSLLSSGQMKGAQRRDITMEMLLAEIAKCDVVCANCHAARTYFQNLGQPTWDRRRQSATQSADPESDRARLLADVQVSCTSGMPRDAAGQSRMQSSQVADLKVVGSSPAGRATLHAYRSPLPAPVRSDRCGAGSFAATLWLQPSMGPIHAGINRPTDRDLRPRHGRMPGRAQPHHDRAD
jgi:hypothetical protein